MPITALIVAIDSNSARFHLGGGGLASDALVAAGDGGLEGSSMSHFEPSQVPRLETVEQLIQSLSFA